MDKVIDLFNERFNKLEDKVDMLIAAHYKRMGVAIAASFLFSLMFSLIVAFIERK